MSDDEGTYSSISTVLGTTRRDARWHLTDEVDILTVFGRARFDLRRVETSEAQVVEISMKCFLGSIDFVVPDGTVVVLDGTSFLAGARSDVACEGDSALPRIEITALTVLGRVRVLSPVDETPATAPALHESEEPTDHAAPTTASLDEPVDDSTELATGSAPEAVDSPVAEVVETAPVPDSAAVA